MKIVVTFGDILDSGRWDDFCDEKGYNPWMINEGLASKDEEVELTKEEAIKWGFLKEESNW